MVQIPGEPVEGGEKGIQEGAARYRIKCSPGRRAGRLLPAGVRSPVDALISRPWAQPKGDWRPRPRRVKHSCSSRQWPMGAMCLGVGPCSRGCVPLIGVPGVPGCSPGCSPAWRCLAFHLGRPRQKYGHCWAQTNTMYRTHVLAIHLPLPLLDIRVRRALTAA